MGKQCFCGCGRTVAKFPLGMRAINTRGRQVSRYLDFFDEYAETKRDPNVAAWYDNGVEIRSALVDVVHGEADPRLLDEGNIRQWQAHGREFERAVKRRIAEFGRLVRKGMTPEEAAAEMVRNDP